MSYVAPLGASVNLSFKGAYVGPLGGAILFDFGAAGTVVETDDALPWERILNLAQFDEEPWSYMGPKRSTSSDLFVDATIIPRPMPNLMRLFEADENDDFLAYTRRKRFAPVSGITIRIRAAQIIG